jgi:hypothetical protein
VEILALIAQRLSNAEIATRQFVSEATVKPHVNRVTRTGARDCAQAVGYAYRDSRDQAGRSAEMPFRPVLQYFSSGAVNGQRNRLAADWLRSPEHGSARWSSRGLPMGLITHLGGLRST